MTSHLSARRRGSTKWFKFTAGLSISVVLLATMSWASFNHVTSSIHRSDVFAGLKARPVKAANSAVNYLLVGSDTREGLSKAELKKLQVGSVKTAAGQRSDTIILIHINKDRNKATIISIPRDTFASIPAWTDSKGVAHPPSHRKINETYGLGGAPLLIATIEAMTNVRIDHYVEVNFAGFAHMVDALGGVTVCLNTAVKDSKSHVDLPAGKQKLDGITALKYVRARYFDGTGDLGRMHRQQKFISSMLSAATSSGTLLNPIKLVSFINAALATVTTDPNLTRDDLLTLATQLKGLSVSSLHMLTVPFSNINYSADGVYDSVLWDPTLAPELWRRIRLDIPIVPTPAPTNGNSPLTIPPSAIDIAVQNGSNVNGLAAKATADLTKIGFVAIGPPTTASSQVTKTTITYDPVYSESLRTIHAALPNSVLIAKKNQGKTFIITLSADYQGPASSAMPTKMPTPATTSPFTVQSGTDALCK
ncbi:MAG TPA: LCP family protein [Candidatus Nanopelagicaceae bacterium]|nr:LCP family protein [Candidatus Nanopelagicaceae bacterium]